METFVLSGVGKSGALSPHAGEKSKGVILK
jgi:hypothetical protein